MILGHTVMNGRAQFSNPGLIRSHANGHSRELQGHLTTIVTGLHLLPQLADKESFPLRKSYIYTCTEQCPSTQPPGCVRPTTIVRH